MIRACSTEIGCELKSLRLETEKNDLHGALRRVMQEEFPYGVKNLPDSHRNSTIHRRSALTASKDARSIWDATQESKAVKDFCPKEEKGTPWRRTDEMSSLLG
jgi:hypothetical protein